MASQIVLIGDHKQLRPIVKNQDVKKLGMATSLFERYYTKLHENRAVMLDTQYRMVRTWKWPARVEGAMYRTIHSYRCVLFYQHEDICEFPSGEFYDGKLKTGVEQPSSVLRVNNRPMPVVFGHIEGETLCLVVKTAKGNNNSKVNQKEKDEVVLYQMFTFLFLFKIQTEEHETLFSEVQHEAFGMAVVC